MKKHTGFLIFFTFIILFYFWKIISMRSAFLGGDYAAQFYPWSLIYSGSIKGLLFPYWTRFFQSGFPLMAEGQVGGFYPLNLVFFFFLPFRIAYNYIVVFHFILAGIFTYIYTRKLGACQWGGALAALLFCFGSAYAGCFYNTVTVKTLIWVPFVLWLFEKYFDNKKPGYVFGAGFILGIQLLAGFTQVAIYSAVFYLIYFMHGLIVRKNFKARDIGIVGGAFALAAFLFLPQFILSWPLAKLSGRPDASLGFALWGSFNPLNFITVVFPYWIFHGTRFYIGILSLLFLFAALGGVKFNLHLRPVILMLLVSVFLALGKYNPLYVLFLKTFKFYSFRNPSKFIFFGVFAASVLSGWGFTEFFKVSREAAIKVMRFFSAFLITMLGLFFTAKGALVLFREKVISLGEWYATNHIYGKDFHRYELNTYLEKVKNFYETLVQRSSILNPFIFISILLCILALVSCILLFKKRHPRPIYKAAIIAIITLDLIVFSAYGTGFRGNIKSFEDIKPECPSLLHKVVSDKGLFRILPYGLASGGLPNWANPNSNAIYGLDSVGAYTPLAAKAYRDKLKDLEVVDDSLGLLDPEKNALEANRDIVRFLNVKYIISSKEIKENFVEELGRENGVFLYRFKNTLPRGFVIYSLEGPVKIIKSDPEIVKYRSGHAVFSINAPTDGFFVFSEYNYPGWVAKVNDKNVRIEKFQDVLMVIRLPRGKQKVEFYYHPFSAKRI